MFNKLDDDKIPKRFDNVKQWIPCLFLQSQFDTGKYLLYFHGNGEDIYHCRELCFHISTRLNVFFHKQK